MHATPPCHALVYRESGNPNNPLCTEMDNMVCKLIDTGLYYLCAHFPGDKIPLSDMHLKLNRGVHQ